MSVLQTLPRLTDTALQATRASAVPLRHGVSSATRAMGARRLQDAVRRRRVTPAQARSSIREGDLAVADLLRPLSAALPMPQVGHDVWANLTLNGYVPSAVMNELIGIARILITEGDLSLDALSSIRQGRKDTLEFLIAIQRGWEARCERLTRNLVAERPDKEFVVYGISLVAVHDAIAALSGGGNSTMDAFDERFATGVVCELADWPAIRLPAHPVHEPEFFRCFLGVWQALCAECTATFLGHFDPALTYQTGMLGEALQDAILTARWTKAGLPVLTEQVRDSLLSEFGIEEEGIHEPLAIYRTWLKAAAAKPIPPHTQAFDWFVRSKATSTQARLLTRTVTLLDRLVAYGHKPKRGTWQYASTGDGSFEMFLVPHDYGVDAYVEPWIDNMYESGETPHLHIAPAVDQPNPSHVLTLADRVMVEAIVATAVHNEILNYGQSKTASAARVAE
jgi:hypothetical protein